jgi:hypothetical protein
MILCVTDHLPICSELKNLVVVLLQLRTDLSGRSRDRQADPVAGDSGSREPNLDEARRVIIWQNPQGKSDLIGSGLKCDCRMSTGQVAVPRWNDDPHGLVALFAVVIVQDLIDGKLNFVRAIVRPSQQTVAEVDDDRQALAWSGDFLSLVTNVFHRIDSIRRQAGT